jgi:hypothetical protein
MTSTTGQRLQPGLVPKLRRNRLGNRTQLSPVRPGSQSQLRHTSLHVPAAERDQERARLRRIVAPALLLPDGLLGETLGHVDAGLAVEIISIRCNK